MELADLSEKKTQVSKKQEIEIDIPDSLVSRIWFLWVRQLMKFNTFTDVGFGKMIDQFLSEAPYKLLNQEKFNIKSLVRSQKALFILCCLLELLSLFFEFSSPVFIQLLISYIESSSPLSSGLILFSCFFIIIFSYPVVDVHRRFNSCKLELRIRNYLFSLIFNKILKTSSTSDGTCMNILTVDTEIVVNFFWGLPYNLFIPLQVFIGLFLIYSQLGHATWLAVGVIFLAFFTNGLFSSTCTKANDRLMHVRDLRLAQSSQFLNDIKGIKANDWEKSLVDRIVEIRKEELKSRRFINALISLNIFYFIALPSIMAVAVIGFYVFAMGEELTAKKTFVTISTLFLIQHPVMFIPKFIMDLIKTMVSLKRIETFLNSKELQALPQSSQIRFENATLSYKEKPILSNLNLTLPQGALTILVGPVGSGKSSFLQSIMGELQLTSGSLFSHRSLAYCTGLDYWLLNATLRDNILLGSAYNEEKYKEVIQSCCLTHDVSQLPAGDLTEIGEKGINLSGGQKARVALARAVYADKEVYLLDDPISAVDGQVAQEIFEKCFLGLLRNKTRILVTHRTEFLGRADWILGLKNGQVAKFIQVDKDREVLNFENIDLDEEEEGEGEGRIGHGSKWSRDKGKGKKDYEGIEEEDEDEGGFDELMEDEDMETGVVSKEVYLKYLELAGGSAWFALAVFSVLAWIVADTVADICLKNWSDEGNSDYFSVYISLKGVGVFMILITSIVIHCIISIKASESSHQDLLLAMSTAPINLFYDVTPVGRILNRLSHDIEIIDYELPDEINSVLILLSLILSIISVSLIYFPLISILIPLILYPASFIIRSYMKVSRELTRLESVSMSPVISSFKEAIQGSPYMRVFGVSDLFTQKNEALVKTNSGYKYLFAGCQEWARLYLGLLSSTFSCCIFLLAILFKDSVSLGSVGLSLSYAFFLPEILSELLMSLTNLENKMIAVERVKSMSAVVKENLQGKEFCERSERTGIEFYKVFMRYRPNTELVLKGLSVVFPQGKNVGIIGRTGSGKSSMFLALLRIVELESGVIFIDGVNIAKISLSSLRKLFTLVPQDPLVFDGTTRQNIDPFGHFNDDEIKNAMIKSGLKFDLDYEIKAGGKNISVGERQMISLSRAFVSKCRFVLFDEATAGIDLETDEKIQQALVGLIRDSTVLTIAHRASTIEKFDFIIELDDGKLSGSKFR